MQTETQLSNDIVMECRKRLLQMREELLNRARGTTYEMTAQDKMSGDEIDQAVAQLAENQFVLAQTRIRLQMLEIEQALARIQRGVYGICEETQEPIEIDRLLAIPYTRVSIEGAEIREALEKKYHRG